MGGSEGLTVKGQEKLYGVMNVFILMVVLVSFHIHVCIFDKYMSKPVKLYTLNMYSLLTLIYTSIKQLKTYQNEL